MSDMMEIPLEILNLGKFIENERPIEDKLTLLMDSASTTNPLSDTEIGYNSTKSVQRNASHTKINSAASQPISPRNTINDNPQEKNANVNVNVNMKIEEKESIESIEREITGENRIEEQALKELLDISTESVNNSLSPRKNNCLAPWFSNAREFLDYKPPHLFLEGNSINNPHKNKLIILENNYNSCENNINSNPNPNKRGKWNSTVVTPTNRTPQSWLNLGDYFVPMPLEFPSTPSRQGREGVRSGLCTPTSTKRGGGIVAGSIKNINVDMPSLPTPKHPFSSKHNNLSLQGSQGLTRRPPSRAMTPSRYIRGGRNKAYSSVRDFSRHNNNSIGCKSGMKRFNCYEEGGVGIGIPSMGISSMAISSREPSKDNFLCLGGGANLGIDNEHSSYQSKYASVAYGTTYNIGKTEDTRVNRRTSDEIPITVFENPLFINTTKTENIMHRPTDRHLDLMRNIKEQINESLKDTNFRKKYGNINLLPKRNPNMLVPSAFLRSKPFSDSLRSKTKLPDLLSAAPEVNNGLQVQSNLRANLHGALAQAQKRGGLQNIIASGKSLISGDPKEFVGNQLKSSNISGQLSLFDEYGQTRGILRKGATNPIGEQNTKSSSTKRFRSQVSGNGNYIIIQPQPIISRISDSCVVQSRTSQDYIDLHVRTPNHSHHVSGILNTNKEINSNYNRRGSIGSVPKMVHQNPNFKWIANGVNSNITTKGKPPLPSAISVPGSDNPKSTPPKSCLAPKPILNTSLPTTHFPKAGYKPDKQEFIDELARDRNNKSTNSTDLSKLFEDINCNPAIALGKYNKWTKGGSKKEKSGKRYGNMIQHKVITKNMQFGNTVTNFNTNNK